jgi:DNA-binding protein YbaB
MFYNKRINELENKIKELNAKILVLNVWIDAHSSDHKNDRDSLDDLVREKLDDAVEQYDFSEAAREALESVASDATFTINF